MLKKILLISLCFFLLTACSPRQEETRPPLSTSTNHITELPQSFYPADATPPPPGVPDFGYHNYNTAQVKSSDRHFHYLRDKVLLSEQYPHVELQIKTVAAKDKFGELISIAYIDEDLNGYYYFESQEETQGGIGVYNLNTEANEIILQLPIGSQAGLLTADSRYLIWMESFDDSNWYKTKLHVYDKQDKQDSVIYRHTINPDTGKVYAWNWNIPVIFQNKLYFDDIVGYDGEAYSAALYAYDFETQKTEKIPEMAKNPMRYRDGILWIEKGAAPTEVTLRYYNGNTKEEVVSFDVYSNLQGIACGGDSVVVANWMVEEKIRLLHPDTYNDPATDISMNCGGLQIYRNNQILPILITSATTYPSWPKLYDHILTFQYSGCHKPIFYDIHLDKIVEIDHLDSDFMYGNFSNSAYLIYEKTMEAEKIYHILPYSDLQ